MRCFPSERRLLMEGRRTRQQQRSVYRSGVGAKSHSNQTVRLSWHARKPTLRHQPSKCICTFARVTTVHYSSIHSKNPHICVIYVLQEHSQIVQPYSNLCLDTDSQSPTNVFMKDCDVTQPTQRWQIQHMNDASVDAAWKDRFKQL